MFSSQNSVARIARSPWLTASAGRDWSGQVPLSRQRRAGRISPTPWVRRASVAGVSGCARQLCAALPKITAAAEGAQQKDRERRGSTSRPMEVSLRRARLDGVKSVIGAPGGGVLLLELAPPSLCGHGHGHLNIGGGRHHRRREFGCPGEGQPICARWVEPRGKLPIWPPVSSISSTVGGTGHRSASCRR